MTERSVMRVVDLLGEGEIEGLVDGLKSVFIDGVAVEDDNGKNIDGVSVELRKGLAHGAAGQEPLAGFDVTETSIDTHNRVKIVRDTAIKQSVEAGFDAVRVTLQWPRLAEVDDQGNTISTDVTFEIASRKTGGNWKTVLTQTVRTRRWMCWSFPAGRAAGRRRELGNVGDSPHPDHAGFHRRQGHERHVLAAVDRSARREADLSALGRRRSHDPERPDGHQPHAA